MIQDRMLFDDYFKTIKIIDSCKTIEQLAVAEKCCEVFLRKWKSKRQTMPFIATAIELIFDDMYTYEILYKNLLSKVSFKSYVLNGK